MCGERGHGRHPVHSPAISRNVDRGRVLKKELEQLLLAALERLSLSGPVDPALVTVERTRDSTHGDFASNAALRLAKLAGMP
ncbi:hypothetical protein EON77_21220, partial [bacterium]